MRATLIALLTFAAACGPIKPDPVPPTPPAPEPDSGWTCITACDRMQQLSCELGEETPEGATCSEVCDNTQDGPEPARWDITCLSEANTCDACD